MGKDVRLAITSGGFTAAFSVVALGFKLAFPGMIVPFAWAIGLVCCGLLGIAATTLFAIRSFLFQERALAYDTHLSEALAYTVTGRWGRWLSNIKSPKTDEKLEAILGKFHQSAADGEVAVWGKPATLPEHHFGSFTRVEKIEPAYWCASYVGWDSIRDGYAQTFAIDGLNRPFVTMIELRVNRKQIGRLWRTNSIVNRVANIFTAKSYAPAGIGSPREA